MESNNRLKDSPELVHELSKLEKLPETIEINGELPVSFNIHMMIGAIKRWNELSDRFKRPVRVYAISERGDIEKTMQRLILEYENLYLMVTPK